MAELRTMGRTRLAVLVAAVLAALLAPPAQCLTTRAAFVPQAPRMFKSVQKGLATKPLSRPLGLRQSGPRGIRAHMDPASVQQAADLLQVSLGFVVTFLPMMVSC